MVYRIAGVYRTRIDEIQPLFANVTRHDDSDEAVLTIAFAADGSGRAVVRAMPAGFYVDWSVTTARFDESLSVPRLSGQPLRDAIFHSLIDLIDGTNPRDMYVDFDRRTGSLTVGRMRLVPFAATPALSARLIEEGMHDIRAYQSRVESTVRARATTLAPRPASA